MGRGSRAIGASARRSGRRLWWARRGLGGTAKVVVLPLVVMSTVILATPAGPAAAATPTSVVILSSAGATTSIGSTVTYTVIVSGNDGVVPIPDPISGSASFTATAANGTTSTLCSGVSVGGLFVAGATCKVTNVDEYPGNVTSPLSPSSIQYGANTITATFTSSSSNYSSGQASMTQTVVDPPTAPYQVTDKFLTISGRGPCSPFSYVQSLDGASYTQDGTGSYANNPNNDLWAIVNPTSAGHWTNPSGNPLDNPTRPCDLNTYLEGFPADSASSPNAGCGYNWMEKGCDNPTKWPVSAVWNCPDLTSSQTTATGCVTDSSSSTPTVVVPSSTIELPYNCDFSFQAPTSNYKANADLSDDPVGSGPGTTSPDGNNAGNDPYGEGDGMACIAQAQVNNGTTSNPVWQPIGQPTTVLSEPTITSSGVDTADKTGNIIAPLPSADAQIRIQYTSFVLQDGSLDGSGVTDVPPGQSEPQAIGSLYCSRALTYGNPTSQGYSFCNIDSAPAVGFTPSVNVIVQPDAELQLSAVPTNIIYQPPTGFDTNSYQSEASLTTQVTQSVGNDSTNTQGESNAFSFGAGLSVGVDSIFKLNVNYMGTWTNGSEDTSVSSTNNGKSLQVTYNLSQITGAAANPLLFKTEKGLRPLPPSDPAANNGHAPWYWDRIIMEIGAHLATYNLNACANGAAQLTGSYYNEHPPGSSSPVVDTNVPTCPGGAVTQLSGYLPYDSGIGSMELQIKDLIPCMTATNGCVFSGPGGTPVKISPSQAKSLIAEDPFAATALGILPPAGGKSGEAVNPGLVLGGVSAPSVGNFDDPSVGGGDSYNQGVGSSNIATWDSSSSYSSTITSEASNSISVSAELDVPLDIVSIGVSASFGYTNDSTTSAETQTSYDKQSSQTNESSWLSTAGINNTTGPKTFPNSTTIYLDPRFNTLMFQVPPPAITSVSTSVAGKLTAVKITDDPSIAPGTTIGSGELDVFACPHGSTNGCQVIQGKVIVADAKKHGSTGQNTDIEVITKFKTSKLPVGSIDYYVSSPGGLSSPYTK